MKTVDMGFTSSVTDSLADLKLMLAGELEMRTKLQDDLTKLTFEAEQQRVNNFKASWIEGYKSVEDIAQTTDDRIQNAQLKARGKWWAQHTKQYEKEYLAKIAAAENEKDAKKRKKMLKDAKKEHDEKLKQAKKDMEDYFAVQDEVIKKYEQKKDKERKQAEGKKHTDALKNDLTSGNVLKAGSAIREAFKGEQLENGEYSGGFKHGLAALTTAVGDIVRSMEKTIDNIALNKGKIDTRLQGSKNSRFMGSYWDSMSQDITKIAGVSPLVKQETVVEKLKTLVGKGISYNVEQRAFLDTLKDKIADTFDATNSSLLRLVRIQQQDTTAARLGMESALTAFLNNMYETTEYMGAIMDGIKGTLEEAESLMGAQSAAAFEYQVQKWMGSMYSVGMSQSGVNNIAGAIGQLASGQIEGVTSDSGKLIIMAANNAGLNLADALANGLDESSTNKLMKAMVDYLGDIYDETKGSKVVQQQYAKVFGLKASDLRAIANLSQSDIYNISSNNLTYKGMTDRLNSMADSIYMRSSIGELMNNVIDNAKYSINAGIANNPVLLGLLKTANMLDVVGGINIPALSYLGTGYDLNTTVANLMRVGGLAGGIVSGLGGAIGGLFSGGSVSGSGILRMAGNNSVDLTTRGTGVVPIASGNGLSASGMVGNASSTDMQDKVLGDAKSDAEAQLGEVIAESNETTLNTVNETLLSIYNLLDDVVSGTKTLSVSTGDDSAWTRTFGHGTTFTHL